MAHNFTVGTGAVVLVVLAVWGSGGSTPTERVHADDAPGTGQAGRASAEADAGVVGVCVGAEDGTVCGNEKHCVAGACRLNECGDALARHGEECDDGNTDPADGCDEWCHASPVLEASR